MNDQSLLVVVYKLIGATRACIRVTRASFECIRLAIGWRMTLECTIMRRTCHT